MDRVRRQLGLTKEYDYVGKNDGFTIAVLDSGVVLHPDLKDMIVAFRDFSGRNGKDGKRHYYSEAYDDYGHGTHVCGILAGNGALSGGKFRGIIPGARLVVGKILDSRGDGAAEDMIKGMRWILELKEKFNVRLLNLSIGISNSTKKEKQDKLREMLQKLSEAGILVICAAGNQGPAQETISFLGDGSLVVSVGCDDGEYFLGDPARCEYHSGRGRRNAILRKPDVVAPGTKITSCSSLYAFRNHGYERRSGTSMATPIVTGCLGKVLQIDQNLSNRELKRLLTSTATDLHKPWNQQGYGMVCPHAMLKRVMEA